MKLVIGGSSGFVGAELVRQALLNPSITSIIGLSRRATPIPDGFDTNAAAKLKSVICDDFETYPDSVKDELAGADACIWTIAVTPTKSKTVSWEETRKVCQDYATTAIHTLATLPRKQDRPLRFVYMSGHFATRSREEADEILKNHGMLEQALMRGEAETLILNYAKQSKGAVQSAIFKPGYITGPGRTPPGIPGLPIIPLQVVAASILDQVIGGFEKDTLKTEDMARVGERAMIEQQNES